MPSKRPDVLGDHVHIGVSGWRYEPWRGVWYPEDLTQAKELEYGSRWLSAIEINGTFYSLQRPSSFLRWYADTPRGFRFAVKGPRFITHILRLRDTRVPLANFFASGVLALEEKLGPVLWQLPPTMRFEPERLEPYFASLPRDTHAASELARAHDDKVKHGVHLETKRKRKLRHALEVRHASFASEDFIALLREHDVALVIAETAGKWPLAFDVTSDFIYVRLHGAQQLYASGYDDAELDAWASRVRTLAEGKIPREVPTLAKEPGATRSARDVFVFFDNTDVKLRAPFDAMALMGRLGLAQQPPGLDPPPALATIRG